MLKLKSTKKLQMSKLQIYQKMMTAMMVLKKKCDYYLRANFTYESPMILAAWLPLIGRYVESERLYTSALVVKHLYPYTEWGYGVSTRLMSLGFFAAFRQGKFDGVGCRFGFELFRNW